MEDILTKICNDKRSVVRQAKKKLSGTQICSQLKCAEIEKRPFSENLQNKINNQQSAIIAEVKKASPSAGVICQDFDAVKIAQDYQENGATCLSILTEEKYFLGSNQYLIDIKKAVDLPILRKDFILDEYQVLESKFIGADCILLIVAALSDEELQKLEQKAIELNLDVLVEVHNQQELDRALKLKSKLIGINNRNLKTLEVDINNSVNLVKNIPDDYVVICESGIKSAKDIKKINDAGIFGFLIGESFMSKKFDLKSIDK